ncbi:HIT family hydrolase [Alkalibacillus silvisoli]|uniref:Uncharacterized protein n=1 Tax=Alkalibacillus silvisoli TaxID=392823 RepID=A0ABP3JK39_9BACI
MSSDVCSMHELNGTQQVEKVYETQNVLAYYHIEPKSDIHIIAFLKTSTPPPFEPQIMSEMIGVIKIISIHVEKEFGDCRVVTHLKKLNQSKYIQWHIISGQ